MAFGDNDACHLFDVIADPLEEKNLSKKENAVFEEIKERYKKLPIKDICLKHTERLKDKKKREPC